ncbi:hypothetical protein SARC_15861, partial [Sphaeroforma arctica JP610]
MAPVSLETGDVSNDTTQQQQHDGTPQADGNTNFDVHTKEVTDFEQSTRVCHVCSGYTVCCI